MSLAKKIKRDLRMGKANGPMVFSKHHDLSGLGKDTPSSSSRTYFTKKGYSKALLVVAMVINTVANHKLHAARTCGSRQRKSSAELEGAAALDMSLPSGKAQKHNVPFTAMSTAQKTASSVRRVNSLVKLSMERGRIAAAKLPKTHMSSLKDTRRVFSWYSWLSSMPQASHGTRATVRQSCVSSAQQVAQARAEGQAPVCGGVKSAMKQPARSQDPLSMNGLLLPLTNLSRSETCPNTGSVTASKICTAEVTWLMALKGTPR